MIGEGQDGRVEGCVFIFSCENSKITTHCWTTIDRRMLHPTKKRCPTSKGKEKPQKEGRRGEIAFRLKPHIHQWCSKGSDKTMSAPGSRDPPRQRLSQTYVWVYYCGQESLRRNGVAIMGNKRVQKCSTWMQSQKQQNDLCSFPRQTIQYHSNASLCPNH